MERIRSALAQRGASLQPSWLASLKPSPSNPDQAWAALLATDLKDAGAAVLPQDIASPTSQHHGTKLKGPILLQVEEIVNIAENWKGRKTNSSNRCLKLTLSDGHTLVGAFEYAPVPELSADSPYGLKVTISNVQVRRGLLLLDRASVTVLGGSAPAPPTEADAMQDASVMSSLAVPKPAPSLPKSAPPSQKPPAPVPSSAPKRAAVPLSKQSNAPKLAVAASSTLPKPTVLAPVKQTTLHQVMQKREAMKRDVKIIDLEDIVEDKPPSKLPSLKRKEERDDMDDIVLYDELPVPAAAEVSRPAFDDDDDAIVGGEYDDPQLPPEDVLLELEREAMEQERLRQEEARAAYNAELEELPVVTLAEVLQTHPSYPVLVSAYVLTLTSRTILDKETQRYALRVIIDDGTATTGVVLGQDLTTQLIGMPASEWSRRTQKPEQRSALLSAIEAAKNSLTKLEGAFRLSWDQENIILEQVLDVPLAHCRRLAARLKDVLTT